MNIRLRTALSGLFLFLMMTPVQAGSWQTNAAIGGFNNVNIYTPDSVSPIGDGRALLVVLHGCTQAISAYLTANLEDAAEQHGMVIAVPDAMNKAGFSCWSYWQGSISRSAGDYANLISLASTLSSDPARQIDSDQVYITGLSSGATFAAQTACVAPDIFAGVAPSAGPTIGTSSSGAIGSCETVSPAQFESRCRSYAGSSYQTYLDTQIAVVGHGTADTTVSTCYNQQNANGYARLYGVSALSGSTTVSEGSGTAEVSTWQDDRVQMLWFDDLAHTWSGGAGASGSYIGAQSINFATYLGGYFADNNLRVNRNQAPEISSLTIGVNADQLLINGTAADVDGNVVEVEAGISRIDSANPLLVEILTGTVNGSSQFNLTSSPLDDGLYEIAVSATDNESLQGPAVTAVQRLGPEPPPAPPQLEDLTATVNGQCATVSGSVVDSNQDLDTVSVNFILGGQVQDSVAATLDGTLFAAALCDLAGGNWTAEVTATDLANLSAVDSISFDIDAGQTGDTTWHIDQGHISWGYGYSECYLAFGTAEFTMRESSAGTDQCVWTADDDASCQGPVQACSSPPGGGDPNPDPDPDPEPDPDPVCVEYTTMNYLHRSAGRAYSSGSFWAPDYYANGSDQPMPGSTYATHTLSSSDDGQSWNVQNCP